MDVAAGALWVVCVGLAAVEIGVVWLSKLGARGCNAELFVGFTLLSRAETVLESMNRKQECYQNAVLLLDSDECV